MAQLNITLSDEVLKELMLGNRDDAVRQLLEEVFNAVLKAEVTEQIKAKAYERTEERQTYRNGYRTRQLTTRVGTLMLHIPKLRDGSFSTQLFANYERSEQALLLSIMEMYISGVSTDKVKNITESLCGVSFSKSTVSKLCGQLDPIIAAFRQRPLSGHYPFLIVDAFYTKARERRAVRHKGVLIATAVNQDGHREVVGFQAGDGESHASWLDFFRDLKMRGLKGVDLVVSDDHAGLVKAVQEQFQGAMWQRCQTHFSRNFLDKIPKQERPEIHARLKDLYNSPDLDEAILRRQALVSKLETLSPKAAILLDESFADITAIFSLPQAYRKRLRTTNSIERLNEEIRRRERVIRIFPNEASIERLIGALLMEHHEKWISGKTYFRMDEYFFERENPLPDLKRDAGNQGEVA